MSSKRALSGLLRYWKRRKEERGATRSDDSSVASYQHPVSTSLTLSPTPHPDSRPNGDLDDVISIAEEQHGLFSLYDPLPRPNLTQIEDLQDTGVDIVAIHGLNGHAKQTWTHANGKCWLKDFLPQRLPRARVYTFGYPAKLAFSRSLANIEDFARRLLIDLTLVRVGDAGNSRPLIFLCHSMGAMIIAKIEDELFGQILNTTRAILFFGTPHRGSAAAELPQVIADIVNFSLIGTGRRIRSDLLDDLKLDSRILNDISNSFRAISSRFRIISFFETESTGPFRTLIVQQGSALMNLPNEEPVPLHGNHRDLCRFGGIENKDYLTVSQKLFEICESGGAKDALGKTCSPLTSKFSHLTDENFVVTETSHAVQHSTIQASIASKVAQASSQLAEAGKIRKWLRAADFEGLRREKKRTPGTCDWIKNKKAFIGWKAYDTPRFLWIHGIPGCGKTVLASYLINSLTEDANVFHFFCSNTDPDKRSTSAILRTIISQIFGSPVMTSKADGLEEVLEKIRAICETYPDVKLTSVDTLWRMFEIVISQFSSATLIIDGLDECDPHEHNRAFLLSKLRELTNDHPKVRVVITSRDLQHLATFIGSGVTEIHIQQTDVQDDILAVIEETVALSSKLSAIKEQVVPAVAQGSCGMFLWARLMLANLETSKSLRSVSTKLKKMPTGLSSMYMRILRDISDTLTEEERQFQRMIFSWIVTAFRPLRLSELRTALSITPGIPTLAAEDLVLDIRADIQKLCGPMISIREDETIQPIHLSVKEALCAKVSVDSDGVWTNETNEKCNIDQQSFHLEVGKTCLTYLSFPVLGHPSTHVGLVSEETFPSVLAESLPFLGYAASWWHIHLTKTTLLGRDTFSLVQRFLESDNCFAWLECYSLFAALAPGEFGHHFQVQAILREWINRYPEESADIEQTVNSYFVKATQKVVDVSKSEFGPNDKRTLSMMSRLGALYAFLDRHVKAREIRLSVLNGYRTLFGAEDLRTRKACTDLGYVTYMLDDFEEAEELFYQALGGRDRLLWERDIFDLETMKELGTVYSLQGRPEEAKAVLEPALQGMIQRLTERHRLTVLCRQYLAAVYRDLGDNEKALEVVLKGHATSIEIQGEDHPDTLRGVPFIANLEMVSGNLGVAEDMLQDLLRRQEQVLGEEHADTYWTMGCLGRLFVRQGRPEAAKDALQKALPGTERIFGVGHSRTTYLATLLYELLKDTGSHQEAERLAADYAVELPHK